MHYRELELALDELLDPVLSSRRTAEEPARALAKLPRARQQFALHWTGVIGKSNSEMAYQFVTHVPRALALLGAAGAKLWLLRAMDIYDKHGLYPGSAAFARIEDFARERRQHGIAVTLAEARPALRRFLHALAGRELQLEAGARICTDTETLYLPECINRFASREKNYLLYKAAAVHLWAQAWFGTFRRAAPDAPLLSEEIARIGEGARALKLFSLLETARLNACIARELPGLARELPALEAAPDMTVRATWNTTWHTTWHTTWSGHLRTLESADAGVADTLAATAALYPLQMPWPDAPPYQGEIDPIAAQLAIEQRLAKDRLQLQAGLDEILAAQAHDAPPENRAEERAKDPQFSIEHNESGEIEIKLDGEPLRPPPDVTNTLSSMLQDLEKVPQEWLQPAGDGKYERRAGASEDAPDAGGDGGRAFQYDEWDFQRESYRKNWCILRERAAHPLHDGFIDDTLKKYAHLLAEIRRRFEALRDADKRVKAQPDGDDIDFDALVTAHADARAGAEMSERLFTRVNKTERDLAVVFMVDASGSTKGWINDAERESLALLCEALEILGDQYAIYAFSGMTRNRCEVYTIKTFAQPYDADARARIGGLRPQDYTRMGATIRHLSKIFSRVESRTKILITLSDGKPDDYDGYRGEYGIEDTRRALLEARHAGIHPFCITIDKHAADYLPHMYGHASYAVVDDVRKLPLKVADIYRRLTT
ncbi:MAG: VWA domain-containing protein [Gammaproteobacteria bacterium]